MSDQGQRHPTTDQVRDIVNLLRDYLYAVDGVPRNLKDGVDTWDAVRRKRTALHDYMKALGIIWRPGRSVGWPDTTAHFFDELASQVVKMHRAGVLMPSDLELIRFRDFSEWIGEDLTKAETRDEIEAAVAAANPPGYWIKASERDLVKFDLLEPPRAGYLEAQEADGLIKVRRINGKLSGIHINDPNRHEEFRNWPKGQRGRKPRNS